MLIMIHENIPGVDVMNNTLNKEANNFQKKDQLAAPQKMYLLIIEATSLIGTETIMTPSPQPDLRGMEEGHQKGKGLPVPHQPGTETIMTPSPQPDSHEMEEGHQKGTGLPVPHQTETETIMTPSLQPNLHKMEEDHQKGTGLPVPH